MKNVSRNMSGNMENFFELQIEIEKSCPLKCLHCSSDSMNHVESDKYLNPHLNDLLIGFNGTVQVSLTGGEPLNRPDILYQIQNISNLGNNIKVGIFSSGLRYKFDKYHCISKEYAIKLKKSGTEYVYISIYHFEATKHDIITNYNGSFDLTKKSIENLINAGIDVKVHFVLSKINISSIHEIIFKLSEIGVSEVRLLRLVKHGRAAHNWEKIGVYEAIQYRSVRDIYLKNAIFPISVTYSGFPEMTPCRPFAWAKGCQAGTMFHFINYKGHIFPCACTSRNPQFKIGNISDERVRSTLWNQKSFQYRQNCLNSK